MRPSDRRERFCTRFPQGRCRLRVRIEASEPHKWTMLLSLDPLTIVSNFHQSTKLIPIICRYLSHRSYSLLVGARTNRTYFGLPKPCQYPQIRCPSAKIPHMPRTAHHIILTRVLAPSRKRAPNSVSVHCPSRNLGCNSCAARYMLSNQLCHANNQHLFMNRTGADLPRSRSRAIYSSIFRTALAGWPG